MKHVLSLFFLPFAIFIAAQTDPNNLDYKKSVEIGLGPLEEYAQRMGVAWKPK